MESKINKIISVETEERIERGEVPRSKVAKYYRLLERIEKEMMPHPVITDNRFTAWFREGDFDREDLRHFLVQFSVFSNWFIEAQLRKTLNAPTLEAMRASKEILMNELGVAFKSKTSKGQGIKDDLNPDITIQTEGSIEGGTFRFQAAHFEWLLRMTAQVGLEFADIGKRRHGTSSTLFFCDELARIYGSDDGDQALGASFSVENWAAAGFWKELIQGLEVFKKRECPNLPLAFFLWHDRVEDQHAAHTWHELEEEYFASDIDEDKFIAAAKEMLNGVNAFWVGLDEDRRKRKNVQKRA